MTPGAVVEELFAALAKMAGSGRIDLQSSECTDAKEHVSEILKRLTQDTEYAQRYTDLLNGSL